MMKKILVSFMSTQIPTEWVAEMSKKQVESVNPGTRMVSTSSSFPRRTPSLPSPPITLTFKVSHQYQPVRCPSD